jgi:hypothetical protein
MRQKPQLSVAIQHLSCGCTVSASDRELPPQVSQLLAKSRILLSQNIWMRTIMRKLGYVLVIIGFACLAYLQLVQSFRGGSRPILRAAYAKAEHGGRSVIPTMEATELLRESVVRCYDSQPLYLSRPGWLYTRFLNNSGCVSCHSLRA